MKYLKKYIRKLYHLIWFLGAFLIFTPSVFAVSGNPNLNGTEFYIPPAVTFYDNTNEHLTSLSTSWNNNAKYYSADISYNGADTAGGNVNITLLEPIKQGYTYSLSVLVGASNHIKVSTKRVCLGDKASMNVEFWEHNYCVVPSWTDAMGGVNFNIVDSSYPNTIGYSVLYYIFTADRTTRSVMVAFNGVSSFTSTTLMGGYRLDILSDNNSLSQNDIQSAVQSSGLATASSVQQVQQSINQVQQQLSDVEGAVNDVNDTLNDSSVDGSDTTINNLKNQIPTNSVISDLLLLPIRFLQNFVNALNTSCSNFSLGSLLGTTLVMPCIDIESYVGSTIWTMIDLIFSGMFVYGLRKKFIQIYENITNLKNGGNEVD